MINDKHVDVITQGEFIEKGKKICVIKVDGSKVVVKEV
jgi:membrane-bound ClpP family serine protease